MSERLCEFEGCGKRMFAKKLCQGHYMQQKAGKLLTPLRPRDDGKWLEKRSKRIGAKYGDLTVTAVLDAPLYELTCICGEKVEDRLASVERRAQTDCGCSGVRVGDVSGKYTLTARGADRTSRLKRAEFMATCVCGRVDVVSAKTWVREDVQTHWCAEGSGMIGKRFERLVITGYAGTGRRGNRKWSYLCDCGNTGETYTVELNRGNVRSCGCLQRDTASARGKLGMPRVEVPGYIMAHRRIWDLKGKASTHLCVDCGGQGQDWSYDGKDPLEVVGTTSFRGIAYSLNPDHYFPRCKKCHTAYDSIDRKEDAQLGVAV